LPRKGIYSSRHLSRHRSVAELTLAWLNRFRRLTIRSERRAIITGTMLALHSWMVNMVTVTRISEQEYRELALNEPDRFWELWDGVPQEKPQMTMRHNAIAFRLGFFLQSQLDWSAYRVNVNGDRTRISSRSYYIPDVIVIPAAYQLAPEADPLALGAYDAPLPLVVEVWSPSTGQYDQTTKLAGYRARGELEVWFIHPVEGTLTAWRKQADGSYLDEIVRGGTVSATSLPNVTIDLDLLLGE
jgi:Uma2 family endonuclease